MKFTQDQKKVIDVRNHNVLVSAAAGSGKTAVLVERIVGLITDPDHPVDIDRLLVVTFTNAAAAEMRERILRVITERLENDPEDVNLQRQAVLIHHAMITTIDSFCRFILMNHFHEISLDPGFSIGEPGKIKLMQKDALAKVMEAAYDKGKELYKGYYEDFTTLANAFSYKGRDTAVEEMTERLFAFIMSQPYPEAWLERALEDYEMPDEKALTQSFFMNALCRETALKLNDLCTQYDLMLRLCSGAAGPTAYAKVLTDEKEMLKRAAGCETYYGFYEAFDKMEFVRLPSVKKDGCSDDVKHQVQAIRNYIKERIRSLKDAYFYDSAENYASDTQATGKLLKPLLYLTKVFMEQFAADKRKENIVDFTDMEHFALQILIDSEGRATDTARWYQEQFEAVMIDEYQDSNDVQELLLSAVSREYDAVPNRFMVGDMKQSIYKFRMARPEIFLEKYNSYGKEEASGSVRIDLKQNFRSRKTVISSVNHIFYPLMHADVGGIDYDASAALYPGASYPEDTEDNENYRTELLVFEKTDVEGDRTGLSSAQGEALVIADRIKELLRDGSVTDKETGGFRRIRYEDIVILMRSVGNSAMQIQDVLKKEGIPAVLPGKTGYFSSQEIQILLQYLEVCVNPYRDIPLAAVLKSPLFRFTNKELAEISLIKTKEENEDRTLSFYEKLRLYDSDKARAFLKELSKLREAAKTETVHDFLYRIIRMHRFAEYVSALPAGGSRRENLEMLLEQAKVYEKNRMYGLFGFLQYIKQLERYEIDYGSGNEDGVNAVRIMTIHKSKGLEFPICFVAGLSGKFYRRDLSNSLLLHADYGIGLEYRDYEKRVRRSTIKQKWIAERLLTDSMGEELRVLYVALTRAGEKCILTGTTENFEDCLNKCSVPVQTETEKNMSDRRLSTDLILSSSSYFKLLCYIYAIYADHPELLPKQRLYHEEDLMARNAEDMSDRELKKESLIQLVSDASASDASEKIKSKINFKYPHSDLEGLFNKTSVSQLKLAALHEDEQTVVLYDTEKKQNSVPRFLNGEKKVIGSIRGTAYHRLLELLDFSAFAGVTDDERETENTDKITYVLEKQIQEILRQKLMTKEESDLVDKKKIVLFFKSALAKEMVLAAAEGLLYKEQPFVMEIPAKRANPKFPVGETMLIQGIIDAFYIKKDAVCLMDYKTDRVEKKEDLIMRYRVQLDYYKEALEKITGKSVEKAAIYSFFFSDIIEL